MKEDESRDVKIVLLVVWTDQNPRLTFRDSLDATFKCVAVKDRLVTLRPDFGSDVFFPFAPENYEYTDRLYTNVWDGVDFCQDEDEEASSLMFHIHRNMEKARCHPWTLRYETCDEADLSGSDSDEESDLVPDRYWVRFRSLEVPLDALLRWDGMRQIFSDCDFLDTPERQHKRYLQEQERQVLQELSRLAQKCSNCRNSKAKQCSKGLCRPCCTKSVEQCEWHRRQNNDRKIARS